MMNMKALLLGFALSVWRVQAGPFPFRRPVALTRRQKNSIDNVGPKSDKMAAYFISKKHGTVNGPRGGDGMDVGLDMATVVKTHGACALGFAALFALESFGLEIPFIGLSAMFEGFDGSDPVISGLVRAACSFAVGVGLMEFEAPENPVIQKNYKIYQIPLTLSAIALCKATAQGPLGWMVPVVTGIFAVLGIIAK